MSRPIILIDTPSTDPKRKAWSINVWKARFSLNYKGIPYRTEWVEYPDIASTGQKYGAPPTSQRPDGSPKYTVPMIYDPNTEKAISDSTKIAQYLDATYPDTPTLFPPGTHALQMAFVDAIVSQIMFPLAMNINPESFGLSERSLAYILNNVLAIFGKPISELGGEHHWKTAEEGLGKVKGWLEQNGPGEDTLFMGDTICFADFQLAALFIWARAGYGEDSEQWKRICGWQDGMWKNYLDRFKDYMAVDI